MPYRPFQRVLGRSIQIQILDHLAQSRKALTVGDVQRKVGVNLPYTVTLLRGLERAGLVVRRKAGRNRLVSLNEAHPLARLLLRR